MSPKNKKSEDKNISSVDKFEEYKLFIDSTDKFSSRRQQVSNTYLTVNSIILAAIAFLVKDAGFNEIFRVVVTIVPLAIGIIVCNVWKQLIYKYKILVNFRIDELREMEKHDDLKGCHQMYHAEDKLYPRDDEGNPIEGEALNISNKEAWLPTIFQYSYILFLVGIVVYLTIKIFK